MLNKLLLISLLAMSFSNGASFATCSDFVDMEAFPEQSDTHLIEAPSYGEDAPYYGEYHQPQNLWVGIEYITASNISWWKSRLGWDAHMEFNKTTEKSNKAFLKNHYTQKIDEQTLQDCYGEITEFGIQSQTLIDMRNHISLDLESQQFYDNLYAQYFSMPTSYNNYMGAFKGFKFNLENYSKVPIWIAYVYTTSEPITGPLSKITSVTSPNLKMSMTIRVGGTFYCPLGIYKSPIANAYENILHPCTITYPCCFILMLRVPSTKFTLT